MLNKITKADITYIIGLGSFFLVIFQNIWTLIETKNFLKENFFLFLIVSFLLALIFYLGFHFFRKKYLKNKFSFQIEEELKEYQQLVDKLEKDSKYYELLCAKWRVGIELKKLENIKSGEWTIKALKTYEYLRYVFGQILGLLSKGDTYTTLSNLDFWSKQRYGATDFISMNVLAAEREVKINRIIVIDNDIFLNPLSHQDEILTLKRVIAEFKEIFLPNPKAHQFIQTHFYLSDDYINDIHPPYPFALISNDELNSKMAVLPNIIKAEDNPDIDVKFLSPSTEKDFNINQTRFDNLKRRSANILTIEGIEYKLNNLGI